MPRVLLAVVAVAVIVFALVDCARTEEERMPARIPKALWILLILFLPVVGGAAWIIASRLARPKAGSPASHGGSTSGPFGSFGPTSAPPRRPARSGPIAPDDDPEFLARLEAERRRREREKRAREARESGTEADGGPQPKGGPPDGPEDSPTTPA